MKIFPAILLVTSNFQTMPPAEHYSETPEAALAEYIDAYKARDIERFLAATDFSREATKAILASDDAARPTDAEIQEKSDAIRSDLQKHFVKFGFNSGEFDNCTQVTKFQDAETQVRILLDCKTSLGSMAHPVRITRFQKGWRVTYGG